MLGILFFQNTLVRLNTWLIKLYSVFNKNNTAIAMFFLKFVHQEYSTFDIFRIYFNAIIYEYISENIKKNDAPYMWLYREINFRELYIFYLNLFNTYKHLPLKFFLSLYERE